MEHHTCLIYVHTRIYLYVVLLCQQHSFRFTWTPPPHGLSNLQSLANNFSESRVANARQNTYTATVILSKQSGPLTSSDVVLTLHNRDVKSRLVTLRGDEFNDGQIEFQESAELFPPTHIEVGMPQDANSEPGLNVKKVCLLSLIVHVHILSSF